MQQKTTLDYIGLGDLKKHGWRGILAFWMVSALSFFLFADQNLIAPNLQNTYPFTGRGHVPSFRIRHDLYRIRHSAHVNWFRSWWRLPASLLGSGGLFHKPSPCRRRRISLTAMGLGIGVGQLVGGHLGQVDLINGWRTSFIVVAAPAFFFALIYWRFCPEPVRGGAEKELEGIAEDLSMEVHRFTMKDLRTVLSRTLESSYRAFRAPFPGASFSRF